MGVTRLKILVGAPVRQKPEIFRAYLESLEKLEKDCTVDYRFYFHNCDLSPILGRILRGSKANVSYEIVSTEEAYVCDDVTHRWDQKNIETVIMIKNRLIQDCMEQGYDYLFIVDSDLILHPKTLSQLLSRGKEIIANIFWTRWKPDEPDKPNAWDMDQYSFFGDDEGEPLAFRLWREPGCYPCGGTGACILIHRKVLEAGVTYDLIPNVSFFGEDRHFCIRAMVLGFQPWIETTYPAFHLYRDEDYQRWIRETQNDFVEPEAEGEAEEKIHKLSSGLEEILLTRNMLVHHQAMSRGELAREHQRALSLLVDGKAEAARQALTPIVEATGSYHACHNLALSELLAGNFFRAEKEFQKLLQVEENVEIRYALGLALLGQGKREEALDQVREAVKADPGRFSFRVASKFLSACTTDPKEGSGDLHFWIERMMDFARQEQLRPVITYLMEYMNLCGGVKITLEHVNRLFEWGYRVNVVTHRLKPDWFPLRVELIRVPLRDRLVNYIPPSDVVIATYWDHAQEALQYGQAVPVLFDQGNLYLFEKDLSSRRSRWYDARFQAMADEVYGLPLRILVVSEVTRELFRQNYGREPYVIPNAVEQRFFYPEARSQSDEFPKILIVAPDGPGWEFKGVRNIFEALRKVREKGLQFDVVWVSQNQRQDFSFPCTFVHRPTQEQLGDIYRKCDIYVHGSYYESFPLPPLEAMTCGVAVVAAANAGVRGYARDGYNSLLVPPGNPERMAEAIERLLVDKELKHRLVEGGLETARGYRWDSIIDRLGAWLTRISLEPRPLPGTDLESEERRRQGGTGWYVERINPGQGDPLAELQHKVRYRFAQQFTVDKKVLDLGCGVGYGSNILADAAREVVGLDISEEAIEYARKNYTRPNLEFRVDNALHCSLESGSFDVVVCLEVIEHLDDYRGLLGEIRRLLKPGGRAIISTPNRRKTSGSLTRPANPFHRQEWLPGEFTQLLSEYFPEVILYGQRDPIFDRPYEQLTIGEEDYAVMSNFSEQDHPVMVALCSKNRPTLSLCMIVKNEEEYLPRCLASVQGVVDEIIVVDTGSTDRTVEIARSFGAKVFQHPWQGDFSEARNVSLEHATGEWILFLDADEELVEEDKEKLRQLLHDQVNEGFYLNEINFVGDQPGQEAVLNMAFRLFRNRKEYRFTGAIHEQIVACVQRHNPNIGFSQVRINHYGYLNKPSVEKNKVSRNLEILLQEVERNPQDNFTRFNLGVEYMRLGQYDRALEQYQKAFHKLPSLEVAYASILLRNIALCLKELKRYKEALKVLADALQAYPDYTDLVFLKGLVYLEMKRYREAAETFKECLRRGESGQRHITQQGVGGYKAWLALGDTYVQLGDEREAVKAYTRAMMANARFPVPVHRLASLLLPREEVEEVKAFFARHLDTSMKEVLLNLAQAFAREGKYNEALTYLDELISREGKTAHLSFARGEYLLNMKRYAEAVGEFAAVPRESEYFYPALLEKAFCHMLQGQYAAASRDLAAAGDSPLYYVHSITYQYLLGLLAGEKPRQVAFTRREDGDKFAALAWDVLGKLLELQEFEAFEKALTMLEGVEDAAKPLKLGKLYYRYGYLESAAEELLRAVQEGVSDSEAFAILGEACREKGLLEDAEVFYSQAMALDPEQVSHYTALTSILARQRKYHRAKEVVKLGLGKFPGSELLKASLKTLEMAAGLTG